jgi:hypothetical protein
MFKVAHRKPFIGRYWDALNNNGSTYVQTILAFAVFAVGPSLDYPAVIPSVRPV